MFRLLGELRELSEEVQVSKQNLQNFVLDKCEATAVALIFATHMESSRGIDPGSTDVPVAATHAAGHAMTSLVNPPICNSCVASAPCS